MSANYNKTNIIMLANLCGYIFDFVTYSMWTGLIVLILSHTISRIHLLTKKHVRLTKQSLVVITGGCMGIGKQMAVQIAKLYHCRILIVDIRRDLFKQVEESLKQLSSSVECVYCDLSDDKSVDAFIENLNNKNKKIDLFIHNAGVHIPKKALQTSEEQFMFQQKVNFISPVKIIKKTIHLTENGHIGVVVSMVALANGGLDVSTYASTKYALYGFVNSFRQQLTAQNRKTTISMGCPYMIRTGMFSGFKTKLDFFFRQLEPDYVGKRLVREFIQKKEVCYVYEYEALLFKIVNFFPSELWDLFSLKFNISNFQTIRNKHQNNIKKIQ